MDAKRLFAFSTWRIARIERPLVLIDTDSGRMRLTFILRDLARGCLLGSDRIELNANCPRWRALHAAVGGLDIMPGSLATLTDAEVDAAIDPATGCLTYRAVPELAVIRADEARRRARSASLPARSAGATAAFSFASARAAASLGQARRAANMGSLASAELR